MKTALVALFVIVSINPIFAGDAWSRQGSPKNQPTPTPTGPTRQARAAAELDLQAERFLRFIESDTKKYQDTIARINAIRVENGGTEHFSKKEAVKVYFKERDQQREAQRIADMKAIDDENVSRKEKGLPALPGGLTEAQAIARQNALIKAQQDTAEAIRSAAFKAEVAAENASSEASLNHAEEVQNNLKRENALKNQQAQLQETNRKLDEINRKLQ